ncbi:Epimerase family protein [compost metagenome]
MNATAPGPVTNAEFSAAIGRVLRRPALFAAPAFVLKLLFGEMADLLLGGQRVVPAKALALGFTFEHVNLDRALARALHR